MQWHCSPCFLSVVAMHSRILIMLVLLGTLGACQPTNNDDESSVVLAPSSDLSAFAPTDLQRTEILATVQGVFDALGGDVDKLSAVMLPNVASTYIEDDGTVASLTLTGEGGDIPNAITTLGDASDGLTGDSFVINLIIFLPGCKFIFSFTSYFLPGSRLSSITLLSFKLIIKSLAFSDLISNNNFFGLTSLLGTIEQIRASANPRLTIQGILRTMFDHRNNLANEVSAQLLEHFGDRVYRSVIPRNVRLAEAPSFGKPALYYDKHSLGALAYLALAGEINRRAGADELLRDSPPIGAN